MQLGSCVRPVTAGGVGHLGSSLSRLQVPEVIVLTPNTTLKVSCYHLIAQLSDTIPTQESTSTWPVDKTC